MRLRHSDAEAAWIMFLIGAGFSQASTRLPRDHVDGMMRVSRIGGQPLNIVQDQPKMLVEVWHADAYQASVIAGQVRAALDQMPDGAMLDPSTKASHVVTTGPFEFPDPSSALKRYQFTFDSLLRRVAGNRTTGA